MSLFGDSSLGDVITLPGIYWNLLECHRGKTSDENLSVFADFV